MTDSRKALERRNAMDLTQCTCANLRKASRAITQAYDAALQPSGLKATQFTLLGTLATQGDAPLTQLAEALVMDRTTLTRNLKPLIRDRLVRIDSEDDRRVRRVVLTEFGRAALEAARPYWEQAQSRVHEALGQDRWAGFLADLTATTESVRDV